jgi:hypothetical protein
MIPVEGQVFFWIEPPHEWLRCSECGTDHVLAQRTTMRFFRMLLIRKKPISICLPVPRFPCLCCGDVRQGKIPFAEARHQYTRPFKRYALELSQHMTIKDEATLSDGATQTRDESGYCQGKRKDYKDGGHAGQPDSDTPAVEDLRHLWPVPFFNDPPASPRLPALKTHIPTARNASIGCWLSMGASKPVLPHSR